jgi:hypothetical protein
MQFIGEIISSQLIPASLTHFSSSSTHLQNKSEIFPLIELHCVELIKISQFNIKSCKIKKRTNEIEKKHKKRED